MNNGLKVAMIQPFLAHYREPIYNLLCKQENANLIYKFYSDTKSNIPLSTINPEKAFISPEKGGLRWDFIHNIWFLKVFLWQTSAIRIAVKRDVDVIVFAGIMYYFSTWIAAILAKLTGKRVLMWTHGYLKKENGFKGKIRELFYRLSDGLLLYGHNARNLLLERGFNADDLYVIYNSLDYEKQIEVRSSISNESLISLKKELFPHPNLPVIVYVGRLTTHKKLAMVIDSVRVLHNRGCLLNTIFVGDGPEQDALKCLVADYALDDYIKFYGACYHEELIGPLIRMADLCVAPGEIGLTCMHAFVYGTPVITHDKSDFQMPEWEAIEPGKTGLLFKHGNIESLADTIEAWINLKTCREKTMNDCQATIDEHYNPNYQLQVINEAVIGTPASHFCD